jgi:transcription-repair coupling factor (superfamily II helicase)
VATVPLPLRDGESLDDPELIEWVSSLLGALFPAPAPVDKPSAESATSPASPAA